MAINYYDSIHTGEEIDEGVGKGNTSAQPNGTYPNMTVGNATNALNANTATQAVRDSENNVIKDTYAKQNGTYPNMTVGESTHADTADSANEATHADSADEATQATSATSANTAVTAQNALNDGQGRNIVNTYATKAEIPDVPQIIVPVTTLKPYPTDDDAEYVRYNGAVYVKDGASGSYHYKELVIADDLANLARIDGTYSQMTVGNATKATQDSDGNVIKDTYATKSEIDDVVTSVNGETGDVTLTASDIYATNTQSVQANLERIDSNVEDVIDDVADLQTSVATKMGFMEDT